MNLIKSVILILVFFCSINFGSNDLPLVSNGDIKFYIDIAGFKSEDDLTYQEFYLMLFTDQLSTKDVEGREEAAYSIRFFINDNFGKLITSKEWETTVNLQQRDNETLSRAIYDQWAELMEAGSYRIQIRLKDIHTDRYGTAEAQITIKKFNNVEFISSEIEFVSQIKNDNGSSPFVKGNKSVVPNPWRRYGILNPVIYFYYELYNIPSIVGDSFNVQYRFVDLNGTSLKTFPKSVLHIPGASISVIHGLNVSNVASGIYLLEVEIVDSNDEALLINSRQFEVIQADYISKSTEANEALDISKKVAEYLLSPDEFSKYEDLNENGKLEFMLNYWRNQDPNPATKENEYLKTIINRYLFANKNFSWANIEGWSTERGRVLIQFGIPDEINRFPFEDFLAPYEVWIYSRERQFKFIFGDKRSDGRYILLHSTLEGEIYNSNWIDELRI
ncbi:MAG: GWxTD domain-containing protein [Melioribacteraceae bacterium]|nr:GWxTD domain-containing protein [Melioribacteraceae bacterium]MCF8355461.1 GWxTD domain-containing protein [Melioribacteraceae bacterium]MCF8392562.1 GWxTD domain-containing protein [Melioribacteraceae bacterium]MCF8418423.1 GWxTD domain-containing protein [Melioribacteraceae bacterium]